MGPANGIVGDDAFGTDLPETTVPDEAVKEVQNAAKYSKSAEFKKIKEHFQNRVDFYKAYMPDGTPIATKPLAEVSAYWVAANVIIGELENVIASYEQAAEAVKEK